VRYFGRLWVHQKFMHPAKSLSCYGLLYGDAIPRAATAFERQLCFCADGTIDGEATEDTK
jgi:hypothetical protein